ncbi:MAG TPA: LysR substrate-binding domain-containing protein, partial [Azospira sp.]|nr:LysR substrate-binding domain-containing protein [Azospira sp.]
ARASTRFAEVLEHPFVMLHAGSAIHTFTMNAAAALGRHLNVRIQVRSFEAVCRMVGAGVGLGLVPRSAVPSGGLGEPPTVVELDEPWEQRDLQVCVKERKNLSGFAALLVDRLVGSPAASGEPS